MIWVVFAGLSLLAVLILALSARTTVDGVVDEPDPARDILIDQLAEIDRDAARGIISEAEAATAKGEVKRRILSFERQTTPVVPLPGRTSRVGLLLALVFVPALAAGYYGVFGNPSISSVATADRQAALEERTRVIGLTDELKARLTTDPNGGPSEGWMLLGQTYMRLGFSKQAAEAFAVVAERPEADSSVFSMWAEALITAEQGVVTPVAEQAIDRAMALDPQNPAATYYRALALQQSGQSAAAYDMIIARLDAADGFYPWMESLVAQANRIGEGIGRDPISLARFAPMLNAPGPTQDDIAAAQDLSPEDRMAFIRSMVSGLAERLKEDPGDLDGWLRLGRAYVVLGDRDAALDAYQAAEPLVAPLPDTDPRKRTVAQALQDLAG